jgi:hypothetical protein
MNPVPARSFEVHAHDHNRCLDCGEMFDRARDEPYCPACQAHQDEVDAIWLSREEEARRRRERDPGPDERLSQETVISFARAQGRRRWRLSKMEYRTWAQRYEIEAGLRDLPDFEHDIPAGRTADERTLIHGIVFLFQCREGWAPDNALPLDRRFLSAWTGLPEHRVRKALDDLKARGMLVEAGKTQGLVETTLWLLVTLVRRVASSTRTAVRSSLYSTPVLGHGPRFGTRRLSFEEVLSRLRKVKRRGKQAYACCPAHNDHNPSLSIREADVPGIGFVVSCHAGCDWRDVVVAIHEAGERGTHRETHPQPT